MSPAPSDNVYWRDSGIALGFGNHWSTETFTICPICPDHFQQTSMVTWHQPLSYLQAITRKNKPGKDRRLCKKTQHGAAEAPVSPVHRGSTGALAVPPSVSEGKKPCDYLPVGYWAQPPFPNLQWHFEQYWTWNWRSNKLLWVEKRMVLGLVLLYLGQKTVKNGHGGNLKKTGK